MLKGQLVMEKKSIGSIKVLDFREANCLDIGDFVKVIIYFLS